MRKFLCVALLLKCTEIEKLNEIELNQPLGHFFFNDIKSNTISDSKSSRLMPGTWIFFLPLNHTENYTRGLNYLGKHV